jgi:D-inositol-3-phosphate glycosyltransferase
MTPGDQVGKTLYFSHVQGPAPKETGMVMSRGGVMPSSTFCAPSSILRPVPSEKHFRILPAPSLTPASRIIRPGILKVSLVTGGWDKPYALGLTAALVLEGVAVDFLGTDEVDAPELHDNPSIHFVSLQGAPRPGGGLADKALRTLSYYWRTIRYATTAQPKLFHILWNTKFLVFDRTALLVFYKLLGKRLVFTAHNVNAGKRDGNDNWLNRLSLKIQYRLVDHIFVHTKKMKEELAIDFHVPEEKVSVIPFGINNTVPSTDLTVTQARERLGLRSTDKVMLFFGHIVPYKGLDYLVSAFIELAKECADYRLVIAGKPKEGDNYFEKIRETISKSAARARILERFEYIPDEETEVYFMAADVLILPYVHIFQSGVLFLSYNFGLPVIACDVGSLKEEILEGTTGFVCRPRDSAELARSITDYFSSELYRQLVNRRRAIKDFAAERYSWTKAGKRTQEVYRSLATAP